MAINSSESPHPIANAALRIGLATAAFSGQVMPTSHEATPIAAVTPIPADSKPEISGLLAAGDNTNNNESKSGSVPSAEIPKSIEHFLNTYTVYMDGCTGMLIPENGKQGNPIIGVAWAAHCGYIANVPADRYWMGTTYETGSDGKSYVVKPPVIASTGSDSGNLTPFNIVDKVIVSASNMSDHIGGVFPGYTVKQFMESYRAEVISEKELESLVPGESKGVLRGWPVNQTETDPPYMTAQEFPMTYVGQMMVTPDDNEAFMANIWAVKESPDDAVCGWGDSGGHGVVEINGATKLLGPESVFWPLKKIVGYVDPEVYNNNVGPQEDLNFMKNQFPDFDWSGVGAVCGFNANGTTDVRIANVVPDYSYIPGPKEAPENIKSWQAGLDFASETKSRTIVDGTVVIKQLDKGGGESTGEDLLVSDPLVSQSSDGTINIGFYDTGQPGQVSVVNTTAGNLVFYPDGQNTSINTLESTGPIIYPSMRQVYASKEIGVTDNRENDFGIIVNQTSVPQDTNAYDIEANDNQFGFIPVSEMPINPNSVTSTTEPPSASSLLGRK